MSDTVCVPPALAIWAAEERFIGAAQEVGKQLGLPVLLPDASAQACSVFPQRLSIDASGWFLAQAKSRIQVDFTSGANHHRRLHGGGRGQSLPKAIGLKAGNRIPVVLDATAGLGRDAFVLAGLGCPVSLYERSGVVHVLLQDGLTRARLSGHAELHSIVQRMSLSNSNAITALPLLADTERPDVIYLDPMFPDRRKTAAVKKEMATFHALLGADADADALLAVALDKAVYRVVVKRPRHAPWLANEKPSMVFEGDSTRFDVYTLRSLAIQ